jgi:hypothetical protein
VVAAARAHAWAKNQNEALNYKRFAQFWQMLRLKNLSKSSKKSE